MALARLDVPSLMLYGGPIAPGRFEGRDVTIQDVFEAVGAHAAGKMSERELRVLEDQRVPGRGRVRRPVHGQHDGDGDRLPRPLAARARTRCRRPIRARPTWRARAGAR